MSKSNLYLDILLENTRAKMVVMPADPVLLIKGNSNYKPILKKYAQEALNPTRMGESWKLTCVEYVVIDIAEVV